MHYLTLALTPLHQEEEEGNPELPSHFSFDPSSLVHKDLRPPGSSYEPITLRMHRQVGPSLTPICYPSPQVVKALTDPSFKKRTSEGFDVSSLDLCSLIGKKWLNDQVPRHCLASHLASYTSLLAR